MSDVSAVEGGGTPRVGLVCRRDHEVFGAVARRLERAGVSVTFLPPGERLDPETLADLSLLANKTVHPESFRALAWAERNGVPTWNGYQTLLLGLRLVGYRALEQVGFDVPAISTEPPTTDYVTKRVVDWKPDIGGAVPVFHQRLVPARPVDYKYYVVDTGEEMRTRTLLTTSKRLGPKQLLGRVTPHPFLAAKLRLLLRVTGSQALGVDFVEAEGRFWAVDLNPTPSFADVGMAGALADSMLATLDTGTPLTHGVDGVSE